jgi:hypothetical protein
MACARLCRRVHHLPLEKWYWRVNAAKLGSRFVLYVVVAFGPASSPNLWGRFAAYLGRTTQAVIQDLAGDVQVYVDDPIIGAAGSKHSRDQIFGRAVLWLALSGFPMAWTKASLGDRVTWIGAELSASRSCITICVPPAKAEALRVMAEDLLATSSATAGALRTFAGTCEFYAGFLPYWKPFVAVVWASIAAADKSANQGGPDDRPRRWVTLMVGQQRFRHGVHWIWAFLTQWQAAPCSFPFVVPPPSDAYIATDASPWGMGAVLVVAGQAREYFGVCIERSDCEKFRAKIGESGFTTLWEALAFLIAARHWLSGGVTPGLSTRIQLRSDSLGALRAAVRLSSGKWALNVVAQEWALDFSLGLYHFDLLDHIPGCSNFAPDCLSRLEAPEAKLVPESLRDAVRIVPKQRGPSYWLATGR